jgi:hypothetical protein
MLALVLANFAGALVLIANAQRNMPLYNVGYYYQSLPGASSFFFQLSYVRWAF